MRKKIIIFGILSIIYIIGFPLFKQHVLDAKYNITVQITGNKNEASQGTEIWIDTIKKDGEAIDFSKLILSGNWENTGRLFNPGKEATEWSFVVRSKDMTEITFITHPYSGMVTITDGNGNVKEIDLYSPEQGEYKYLIDIN